MEVSAFFVLAIVLAFIGLGMLLTRTVAAAVFPLREELFRQGTRLLNDPELGPVDRHFVEFCLDNALSFKAGWMPVWVAWRVVLADMGVRSAPEIVERDFRTVPVGIRFILSVLAANLFAAVAFSIPLVAIMIAERQRAKPAMRHAAEGLQAVHC